MADTLPNELVGAQLFCRKCDQTGLLDTPQQHTPVKDFIVLFSIFVLRFTLISKAVLLLKLIKNKRRNKNTSMLQSNNLSESAQTAAVCFDTHAVHVNP